MLTLTLMGLVKLSIKTGIGFLDHMMEQIAKHSLIDIDLIAKGDLHIDFHHTTEDSGIVFGEALKKGLGDKKGIKRYASVTIPMDETLSRVSLDLSNRPYLVWNVKLAVEKLVKWIQNFLKNGFMHLRKALGSHYMLKIFTVIILITK